VRDRLLSRLKLVADEAAFQAFKLERIAGHRNDI
jgi:hypothetical protein